MAVEGILQDVVTAPRKRGTSCTPIMFGFCRVRTPVADWPWIEANWAVTEGPCDEGGTDPNFQVGTDGEGNPIYLANFA